MAIVASNLYSGRVVTGDSGYPLGKAQDIVNGEKGTGTPLRASWVNDQWGFLQALLDAADITPSGTPDQVGQSDYLDAVNKLIREPLALKIFQNPSSEGLTEIQTRTVDAGEVYEVRKTSDDSLATIYSDSAGTTEIVQNGTSNVSDGAGVVEFYIADGDYYVGVNSVKGGLLVSGLKPFLTVADMTSASYLSKYEEGTRIEWQGYYAQSDGGSNWGVLKFGDHTADGGSIFSIDSNTYIEANLRSTINALKFGATDSIEDNASRLQAIANYLNTNDIKGEIFLPALDGSYKTSEVVLNNVKLVGDGTIEKISSSEIGIRLLGSDALVKGIRFTPQSTSGQPNSDIKLGSGLDGVLIEDCKFYTPTNATIYSAITAADDPSVSGGDFDTFVNVKDLKIHKCKFDGYTRPVYLHRIDGYNINFNVFRNTDFDAIRIREIIGEGNILYNQFYDIGDPTWPDSQTRDCIDTAWSGYKLNIVGNVGKRIAYVGIDIKGTPTTSFGYGSELINVKDNFMSETRYAAYSFAGSGYFKVSNNVADRFNLQDSSVGDAGFHVKGDDSPEHFDFDNNTARFGNGRGFYVETGCSNFTMSNDRSINNKDSAFHVGNCDNYKLDGLTGTVISGEDNDSAQVYGLTMTASAASSRTATIINCNFLNNVGRQVRINGSGFTQNIIQCWRNNAEEGLGAYNTDNSLGRLLNKESRMTWTNGVTPSANDGENVKNDIHFFIDADNVDFVGRICSLTGIGGAAEFRKFGRLEKDINTTFTTTDGKTVTVVDGFIDSIF